MTLYGKRYLSRLLLVSGFLVYQLTFISDRHFRFNDSKVPSDCWCLVVGSIRKNRLKTRDVLVYSPSNIQVGEEEGT